MKKILIPVDFSVCADNAIHYAIQLARITQADLHLCHAMVRPPLSATAGLSAWPQSDEAKFSADTEKYMKNYAEKIIREENLTGNDTPNVTFSIVNGTVKEMVNKLIHNRKIDLIVMGLSGAGEIKRFIMGSNSREQIEHAVIPILLVPRKARFSAIKKIAFATDLNWADVQSINTTARLFCMFEPELLLAHIDGLPSESHVPTSLTSRFLKTVEGQLNYSKIYYRYVQQKNINDGLIWFAEKAQIDVLAMVHRHKGIFAELVHGSHTQHVAKKIALPLLVLPEGIYKDDHSA